MTKAEKIKKAKVVAHWIKDLKVTVTLVRTSRKVYTGRGEWHFEHRWNSALDELKEFDLETFRMEMGLSSLHSPCYLAENLVAAGYKVFDSGAAITIWTEDTLNSHLEYLKARVKALNLDK